MTDQETPLFSKIYELYNLLYKINKNLPKRDRYTLGQRIENCCLDLLKYILSASNSPKQETMSYLKKANIELEFFKVIVRVANKNNLFKIKQYLEVETMLQEAGKMLGGWIRYQQRA